MKDKLNLVNLDKKELAQDDMNQITAGELISCWCQSYCECWFSWSPYSNTSQYDLDKAANQKFKNGDDSFDPKPEPVY